MGYLSSINRFTKENKLLALTVLVGGFLRIISTSPGYYYPIGDELLYSQSIYMIINRTLSLELPWFGFPPLIPWIMLPIFALVFLPLGLAKMLITQFSEVNFYLLIFVIPFILFLLFIKKVLHIKRKRLFTLAVFLIYISLVVGSIFGIMISPILQREILGKNWIHALYWGRYITAIVGTLVIVFTYKVSQVYFKNRNLSLFSAIFVSVNYRMVLSSHIGLPDMYNVFFLLLALYAIGKILQNQSFKTYLLAILSQASFFMIKYQTHIVFPFLIVHTAVSLKGTKNISTFIQKFFARRVIYAGIFGILFVFVSHFYHFQNWSKVLEINAYQAIKYGFGRNILDLYPVAYLYNVGVGPALSFFAIFGIVLGIANKKYRLATFVLLSTLPSVAFLYLYYTNGGIYTRNVIATIPVFLIFSALFLSEIYSYLVKKKVSSQSKLELLLTLTIVILILHNFYNSIVAAHAYSQVAPRTKAQNWVDENIKKGEVFGAFLGTTWPTNSEIEAKNLLPFYKAFSYQEMLEEKYDYMSIEMSNVRDQFAWWTRQIPKIQISFWQKPDDLLSQSYYALAFRESIWRAGVATFLSPWQAPSHNFVIVKFNKDEFSKVVFKPLMDYSDFSSKWSALYYSPNYDDVRDNVLSNKQAALTIKQGRVLPGSARHESEKFITKSGYVYKVTAQIKTDKVIPKEERDGFIRLDFYNKLSDPNILSRPILSFVSKRVFGEAGTYKVEFTAIAPPNTQFATLGFQADGTAMATFNLEKIEVYESSEPVQDKSNHFTISDDDLFLPNNDGVL